MPKSKTRKVVRPQAPRPVRQVTPQDALEAATLALYQASTELVREAELHIMQAARAGEDPAKSTEQHHYLRTGALGILIAYSKMTGLPDPREAMAQTTNV